MNVTYIILITFYFTVTNGKYQYEGFRYTVNRQTGTSAARYPQKVEHDPTMLEKVVWSYPEQNLDERIECACPVEHPYLKQWLTNDVYKDILFRVDREDDNCGCHDQVQHSIISQDQYGIYDIHLIAFKIYYETDAKIVTEDYTPDLLQIKFPMKFTQLPILWLGINKNGNRFVWHYISNSIEPKRPTIKLSKFKAAPFEEITSKLHDFYEQKAQFKIFKSLMDADTVENLTKNNIFLVPQQLAREELMLLNNEKPATMYNFNLIPIWNNIANDWADIQNAIIEYSGQRERNINPMRIVSGIYGSYYCKKEGSLKPLYLKPSFFGATINVPYYIWNLYFLKKGGKPQYLFVIMHNDYHPNRDNPQQKKLCEVESKCEDYTTDIIKKKKGVLVYCCVADGENLQLFDQIGLEIDDFSDEKSPFLFESHKKR